MDKANAALDKSNSVISDYVGFNPMTSEMELVAEKANNAYMRVTFSKDENGNDVGVSRLDYSLQDPHIVNTRLSNNLIGIIRSKSDTVLPDIIYDEAGKTADSSIVISEEDVYPNSPLGTFNPYYRLKMSDIVKAFTINGWMYNIHRGGYISLVDLRDKKISDKNVRVVNFTKLQSYKEIISLQDNRVFGKYQYSTSVTGVSYDGASNLLITTANDLIIYNTLDDTYSVVDSFSKNAVVIDLMSKGKNHYAILGSYKSDGSMTHQIVMIDVSGQILKIQPNGEYDFPNTIANVGDGVVFYNNIYKCFPQTNINSVYKNYLSFAYYNDTSKICRTFRANNILGGQFGISFIEGSSLDSLYVGVRSRNGSRNSATLNNSVLYIDKLNNVKFDIGNRFSVGNEYGLNIGSFSANNHVYIHDKRYLDILKVDNGRVIGSKKLDLVEGRNTTTSITHVSLSADNVVVLYNDNTHNLLKVSELEDLVHSGISSGSYGLESCVVTCDDKTFILDDSQLTVLTSDDPTTTITCNHTYDIFDISVRDILFKKCIKIDDENYFISIITKYNRDIVCHAIKVHLDDTSVSIETRYPASFQLNAEDKIIVSPHVGMDGHFLVVPVMCATSNFINIVYDIDEDITIINKVRDDDEYIVWKVPFADERAEFMSLQIYGDIHKIPIINNFFNSEDEVNGVVTNEIELSLLLSVSVDSYPITGLLNSTPLLIEDNLDRGKAILGGTRINDLTGPRIVMIPGLFPHYAVIDNFFIKVFDSEGIMVGITAIRPTKNNATLRICGVERLNDTVYRIDTDAGDYYTIDLSKLALKNRLSYSNLNVLYTANEKKGLYAFYDIYGVINVYDSSNRAIFTDALNIPLNINGLLGQFRSNESGGCRFKVDSIEKSMGVYFLSLSVKPGDGTIDGTTNDTVNYYLLVIATEGSGQESKLLFIGSSASDVGIDCSDIVSNVDTRYSTFSLTLSVSNGLFIYYSRNTIKARYINLDENTVNDDTHDLFVFGDDQVFLGMDSSEQKLVDVYYTDAGDISVYTINCDALEPDSVSIPKIPSNDLKYRSLFRDRIISVVNQITPTSGLQFRSSDIHGERYTDSHPEFTSHINTLPLTAGRNDLSISLFREPTLPECEFITIGDLSISGSDTSLTSKKGYEFFNYHYRENRFSNLLFSRFNYSGKTACISTGGLSRGLIDEQETIKDRHFKGVGGELLVSNTTVLEYDLNMMSCIKDLDYYNTIRTTVTDNPVPGIQKLYSALSVADDGTSRYINYTKLPFKEVLAVTKTLSGLIADSGDSDPNVSYSVETFKEEQTDTNPGGTVHTVLMSKTKNETSAFTSLVSIDGVSAGLSEAGFSIWPLFCDEDGLHSALIKDDYSVIALVTDNGTPYIIPGTTGVRSVVKVPGYPCIFMTTGTHLITYNYKTNRFIGSGIAITDISNYITDADNRYTTIGVLRITNNLQCSLLLRNNKSGLVYLAPVCNITEVEITGSRVDLLIDMGAVGLLESYNLQLNGYIIPFISGDNRYYTLNDNVLIDMSKKVWYELRFTNIIGSRDLGDIRDPLFVYEFEAYGSVIKPSVFISMNFWLLQRNNYIEIYRIGSDRRPHASPVFIIEQAYYKKMRSVSKFMDSYSRVVISFTDGSCKEIRIDPKLEDKTGGMSFSADMYDFGQVYFVANMSNLSYFGTVYGVGFVGNKSLHIYRERSNDYLRVKTGLIRTYTVDTLASRVYIIDEDNNLGYVKVGGGTVDDDFQLTLKTVVDTRSHDDDGNPILTPVTHRPYMIDDSEYVGVGAMKSSRVLSVSFNDRGFLTFVTDKGVFIYLNDKVYTLKELSLDYENYQLVFPSNRSV